MTATPKTMARQITVSRQERTERARVARVATQTRLAYSTSTGDALRLAFDLPTQGDIVEDEHEPHCFVCGRHTDHFAEHDDMVAAGQARYGEDGTTYPVPWLWD